MNVFSGARWYAVMVRDLQVMLNHKQFGNHWIRGYQDLPKLVLKGKYFQERCSDNFLSGIIVMVVSLMSFYSDLPSVPFLGNQNSELLL